MSGLMRDGWEYDDGTLYVKARPLPSGNSNPDITECVVSSDWQETRDLLCALLAQDLDGLQVRVDLTELTEGYEGVVLYGKAETLHPSDYEEAKAAARYMRRAAERLDAWAEAHAPSSPGSET